MPMFPRTTHPARSTGVAPWLAGLVTVALLPCGVPAQNLPEVHRLTRNPIVGPDMISGDDGANINGPSLMRVPGWIADPLGRYYLYFAHHRGQYIRMAYADELAGPWQIHEPGTVHIQDTSCRGHVASPDVHVDAAARRIRLYFHCPPDPAVENHTGFRQVTFAAVSEDGLSFSVGDEPLGSSYFRVFRWRDVVWALGMPGVFYRSADGLTGFEQGPTLFTPDMRHSAVRVDGDRLQVFYTVVGENPERILYSEIPLTDDWMTWKETPPVVVLEPETTWEGGDLPREPSVRGAILTPVRQLRDPALFEDEGRWYLLYAVAGEQGIAFAEVTWP